VYYGILLILEKLFLHKLLEKIPRVISWIYTMIIVIAGWGIFGMADVLPELKMSFVRGAVFLGDHGLCDSHTQYLISGHIVLLVVAAVISTGVITKAVKKYLVKYETVYAIGSMVYVGVMMVASTACIVADTYNPFLYFRF
jgi:alginate O-acetyltransferase complex protein AlgI